MAALLCPGGLGFNRKDDKYGFPTDEYLATPLETRLLQHRWSDTESRACDLDGHTTNNTIRQRLQKERTVCLQVVQDFLPTSALEIPVKQGEFIRTLHYDGSWLFVQTPNGANGYIPRRNCRITELRGVSGKQRSQHSPPATVLSDVGYVSDTVPISIPVDAKDRSISHDAYSEGQCSSWRGSLATAPEKQRSSNASKMLTRRDGDSAPGIEDDLFQNVRESKKRHYRPSELADEILTRSLAANIPVCGRRCGKKCTHQQNFRRRAHTEAAEKHRNISSDKPPIRYNAAPKKPEALNAGSAVAYSEKTRDKKTSVLSRVSNSLLINDTRLALQAHRQLQQQVQSKFKHSTKSVQLEQTFHTAKTDAHSTACNHPQLIVIEEYKKQAKTDVTVRRGDFATILDESNPIWTYVQTEDGRRGYVPKEVVINHKCQNCFTSALADFPTIPSLATGKVHDRCAVKEPQHPSATVAADASLDACGFCKLLISEDYQGGHLDDMRVTAGDIVVANMKYQLLPNWLWVYSTKTKMSGYIPDTIVRQSIVEEV